MLSICGIRLMHHFNTHTQNMLVSSWSTVAALLRGMCVYVCVCVSVCVCVYVCVCMYTHIYNERHLPCAVSVLCDMNICIYIYIDVQVRM